jgi:hypothetical protein
LAGYAQNRERSDARDRDIEQQQRAEARQAMLDERQRVQMEAQAQSMKEQRERQQRMDERQGEQDRNAALDDGLRDTEPTRQGGALMRGAAELGASMGGGMGATMGALGSYGKIATDAANGPQYSVGGKSMSRAALSMAQQTANAKAAERNTERTQDREWQVADRDQSEKRADARAAADRASRRDPGVNMQVIQTADGPMAFNPRTGETKPIMANGKQVQPKPDGRAMGLTGEPAKRAEAMSAVTKELAAYRAMLDAQGPSLMNLRNEDKTRIESQYGNLQMTLKEAYNLGVLNGPDLALIEKQITPPVGFAAMTKGKSALLGQVDQVGAGMKRRQQAQSEVYGAQQSAPDVNTDALRSQAVNAIRRGADPAAVRERFEKTTGQRWED